MKYTNYYFASTYGSGVYNSSSYQNASSTSSSTSTPTSTGPTAGTTATSSGGTLANTGFDLLLAATIGSVVIFSALVIKFWKKPAKNQNEA